MGKVSTVGSERVAKNGYHYTRTESGWRLTHHVIAEQKLGRAVDSSQERVRFIDGDRSNLDPSNIEVVEKKNSKANKIKDLKSQIRYLQAELELLESEEP